MIDPAMAHPELDAFGRLSDAELIARYRIGVENYDPRVVRLNDQQLDTAFLADAGVGQWPCRVLLGHMADADPVWNHRMRRAVGEDQPVFALWDENAFIDAGLYGGDAATTPGPRPSIGAFIAVVHTERQWVGEWLASLPVAMLRRKGMHPVRGELTVRRMLELTTWHLEHHAWYLNRKVAKMLGSG